MSIVIYCKKKIEDPRLHCLWLLLTYKSMGLYGATRLEFTPSIMGTRGFKAMHFLYIAFHLGSRDTRQPTRKVNMEIKVSTLLAYFLLTATTINAAAVPLGARQLSECYGKDCIGNKRAVEIEERQLSECYGKDCIGNKRAVEVDARQLSECYGKDCIGN
ncbi:uncharacterized protein Z519_05322 [Cladophialophora bantiana CBS 173.52]|uniref:Uncharacterized protein n=1 Tax=Cladophialophora bantiana (strain ATCC 10958 / CBS 173.52 / CDC B-1940 / NIH 8579) TaxID=1442370 RepID=A0A0D2EW29_CLAB1|nr:uncharacterized protein Z519_05322 [Cladophialophora bantiana CBS 173.52]KIW94006.1 hypothetical protein Z519_05322 [Cladophialophora bantiana CBS 173.52]